MEVSKSTIAKALLMSKHNDNNWNIMTIQDALQWEDREDYASINDAVNATIEDNQDQLKDNPC